MERYRIAFVGESGSGLLSTGEIFADALQELGFLMVTDREYPSLIKGGASYFVINFAANVQPYSTSEQADVLVALDLQGVQPYHDRLADGGVFIHGYERSGINEIVKQLTERGCSVSSVESRELAHAQGGSNLMTNVVLLGTLWKTLGLPWSAVEHAVTERFKAKPKLLEIDLKCLQAGYDAVETQMTLELPTNVPAHKKLLHNAHQALALGAIHAGCRAYYAYPMSPSSNILSYMDAMKEKTGMVVKQVEDEIAVAQMTIGSMFTGTRALAATSGGGFDLMTESVSLAGIIENPFVLVVAQRPGPGTGLPTWTAQGDLQLAIHGGHGEFARIVLAPAHPEDTFELIQHAFNLAEQFQTVVLVLTEKLIGESLWTIDPYQQNTIAIERGLVTPEKLQDLQSSDRYAITESGVSKRWLPGSTKTVYFANGDEHWESGELTEQADPAGAMYAKRNRKMTAIQAILPEPEVYGVAKDADISFIGFGSSLNSMRDAIALYQEQGVTVNYLHYSFVYPLQTAGLQEFVENNTNIHVIENNYTGQFEQLIRAADFGDVLSGSLRKWNGRPFFTEDLTRYISNNLNV